MQQQAILTGSSAALRGAPLRTFRNTTTPAGRRSLRVAALKVGDKAPDFKLSDESGKAVSLKQFQGFFGKPVVLYFYPSDGSPGCTKQAKAFKDASAELKKAGAVVLGVSSDSVESHAEFKASLDLPFPLLADEDGEVRAQYEVPKDLFGLLPGRQTFVIDNQGTIVSIYNDQFGPEKHIEKALEALTAKAEA